MRIKPKLIATWAILPAAAVLIFAVILPYRGHQKAERQEKARIENKYWADKWEAIRLANEESTALVARIERLSRGLIRQAQASEIVRILQTKCDNAIKADMIIRLIDRESRWDPRARGQNGEVGLCQLKPSTAGIPAAALADPARNVAAGIDHLRGLLEQTGEIGLALAAYNTGLYSPGVRYARAILGE